MRTDVAVAQLDNGKTGDCAALQFDTDAVRQHFPFLLSDNLVALERHERYCYRKSVSMLESGSRFVLNCAVTCRLRKCMEMVDKFRNDSSPVIARIVT